MDKYRAAGFDTRSRIADLSFYPVYMIPEKNNNGMFYTNNIIVRAYNKHDTCDDGN